VIVGGGSSPSLAKIVPIYGSLLLGGVLGAVALAATESSLLDPLLVIGAVVLLPVWLLWTARSPGGEEA